MPFAAVRRRTGKAGAPTIGASSSRRGCLHARVSSNQSGVGKRAGQSDGAVARAGDSWALTFRPEQLCPPELD
jgi:hypothetical protein